MGLWEISHPHELHDICRDLESFRETKPVFVICLDMSKPWTLFDDAAFWIKEIEKYSTSRPNIDALKIQSTK
jgi:tRNA A58 N-methylase Trm61